MQAALAASARADASLTGLFRAIQQLGNGVGGAREANESLTIELEGLRDLLGVASERQQVFERKISELELVLDRTRKEHVHERVFLIDQQDLFLVKLLDEQELELKQRDDELAALRARLAEPEQAGRDRVAPAPSHAPPSEAVLFALLDRPGEAVSSELERAERAELERTAQKLAEDRERARETVARLQAQRDEAQNAVARIAKERDEALYEIHRLKSELGGPRIPLSTRPPSGESSRDSSSGRSAQVAFPAFPTLGQLDVEARRGHALPTASDSRAAQPICSVLNPPHDNPRPSPIPSRPFPPPSRLSPPPSARHSPPTMRLPAPPT